MVSGSTGDGAEEEEEGEEKEAGHKVKFPVKESGSEMSEISECFTVKVGKVSGLQGTAEWQGEMATTHGSGSESTVPVS